jgi:two-component system chemotaxis response regulator CheB
MSDHHAIVIGASAGGLKALQEVVSRLPDNLPAPVFVVMHVPSYTPSKLPEILSGVGPLAAAHPTDGEPVRAGQIYVARPDHHLLVEEGRVLVKRGPKENRFRPSIDALFRSAAYVYGPAAIGVILSGALDDGTSGLWNIHRLGGTSVVQRPDDAEFANMPGSALEHVPVDYSLPSTAIGPLLARLVSVEPPARTAPDALSARIAAEVHIASEGGAFQKGIMDFGELTPFTCPECHGALVRLTEGPLSRFRCHTGHAYSDSALLEGIMESTGEMLWQVMRSLEEAVMLLDHVGRHLENSGASDRAAAFLQKARDLERRSTTYRRDVLKHESLSFSNLEVNTRE